MFLCQKILDLGYITNIVKKKTKNLKIMLAMKALSLYNHKCDLDIIKKRNIWNYQNSINLYC